MYNYYYYSINCFRTYQWIEIQFFSECFFTINSCPYMSVNSQRNRRDNTQTQTQGENVGGSVHHACSRPNTFQGMAVGKSFIYSSNTS